MPVEIRKSWLRGRIEGALVHGLTRAYETVKVDPDKFLLQLRAAYSLPITSFDGVYSVDLEHLDDVAESIVRSSMKIAAAEGAGLGLGGIATIVPDLGILSAITMRTIQKLSLVYGFEFNTEEELADLWIAAASAANCTRSAPLMSASTAEGCTCATARAASAKLVSISGNICASSSAAAKAGRPGLETRRSGPCWDILQL